MKKSASRIIGLTGGIGTGKTTVSDYLATKYHLPVLDADIYAREAVANNSSILLAIFDHFGNQVKLKDGSLDRPSLAQIIFHDEVEKRWLEEQIHPYVRDRFQAEIKCNKSETIVLDIPLLFEAKLTNMVTEIWVVSCDRALQISRLQRRNNLTLEQAQSRIDSQLPLTEKVAAADIVLYNNSSLLHLYAQVDRAIIEI